MRNQDKIRKLIARNQQLHSRNASLIKAIKNLKAVQKELIFLAHYDSLTQLPNRLQFIHDLQHEITRAQKQQHHFALLKIDLDFFKNVNDCFGHDVGDCLLYEVALRLRSCIRENDCIARLGGDEFAVILTEINDIHRVQFIAQQIIDTMSHPFQINTHTVSIGTSIGIAYFPEAGSESQSLYKSADIALYQVKEHGRNHHQFFTPFSSSDRIHNKLRMNT
ncbi:MAG: GGDEF domain-containing protein [Legionella sp.]|uniref:diguanylate cyclase domain-containing protein n=1 Tax=Legionella sp. TaxID=459 RepID=UPI0039E6C9D9